MLKMLIQSVFCFSLAAICQAQGAPEATSLLGKALFAPELTAESRAQLEQNLAKAKADSTQKQDADSLIWLGRRTAYLGRFREAIEIFSQGVEKYPNDPRFYRHRGHRYLTVREIENAIADFEKAARLIEGKPDEIEPDGIPNAKNIPRSTINSNIWYHLGLAYYLKGDFKNAERAYKQCLMFAKNDDMLVATSHWLYMTFRRSGKKQEADEILRPIGEKMDIIEDTDYHELLLMYKGLKTPKSLIEKTADDLGGVTIGYGVANWHLYNGDKEKAIRLFETVLKSSQWPAFGYLAAEAELARLGYIGGTQPVEVTYLGNEGFLIESGSQSVLIDALFGSGLVGYPIVPQVTREAIESANGKFSDVDLILASHHHADHFDARSVFLHMINNPEARFFSTLQAVQKLQALKNWKQIESRVQISTPPEGESFSYEHSGIQLVSYNLHHGKDTPRPVENIGWLIRIGGKTFFHLGDTVVTAEEIAPLRLQEKRIDIKFSPFWLFLDSEASKMRERIPALHTIVMHIPEASAPEEYFGDIKNHKNLLEVLQRQIQKQDWIPLQPNESRIFGAETQ